MCDFLAWLDLAWIFECNLINNFPHSTPFRKTTTFMSHSNKRKENLHCQSPHGTADNKKIQFLMRVSPENEIKSIWVLDLESTQKFSNFNFQLFI
jgi:hypothetical protein